MARDYKSEYKNYQGKPGQIKKTASRVQARRKMIKAGKAKVGDGKDVSHKNGNPKDNRMSNLKMESPSKNRSVKRTKTSRKVNPKD